VLNSKATQSTAQHNSRPKNSLFSYTYSTTFNSTKFGECVIKIYLRAISAGAYFTRLQIYIRHTEEKCFLCSRVCLRSFRESVGALGSRFLSACSNLPLYCYLYREGQTCRKNERAPSFARRVLLLLLLLLLVARWK